MNSEENIFITFDINGEPKISKINKYCVNETSELMYLDFVLSALQNTIYSIEDFDHFENIHGAEVNEEIFIDYLKCYYRHPSFILSVKTKNYIDEDSNSLNHQYRDIQNYGILRKSNAVIGSGIVVTSDALKTYIHNTPLGLTILSEHEQNKYLTENQRRRIISILANYIQESFGFKPSREQQTAAAKACVNLFPCLKSRGENELDLLINCEATGFLQIKLKNDRVKKRKLESHFSSDSIEIQEPEEAVIDDETAKRYLHIINSAVLPDEILLVKAKLKATVNFRKEQRIKADYHPKSDSPYYFIHPELILFDFNLCFPQCHINLSEAWSKYEGHIIHLKSILYTEFDRNLDWNTSTLTFLNLIRLLPPSPSGRQKQSRSSDEQAVQNLIRFFHTGQTNAEYVKGSSIMDIIFNRVVYRTEINKLKMLIKQHLSIIINEYKAKLIPKHHILTHYPNVLKKIGPLWQYSTMRYESKHQYFKNICSNLRNYINLPKTLALRHQQSFSILWENYQMKREVKCGKYSQPSNMFFQTYENILSNVGYQIGEPLYMLSFIEQFFHYRPSLFISLQNCSESNHISTFLEIKYILSFQTNFMLLCEKYNVKEFDEFHNCYEIEKGSYEEPLVCIKLLNNSDLNTYEAVRSRRTTNLYIIKN